MTADFNLSGMMLRATLVLSLCACEAKEFDRGDELLGSGDFTEQTDLVPSVAALPAAASPSVVINGTIGTQGNAYTKLANVTLSVDPGGAYTQMCVSNTVSCSAWESIPANFRKTWPLTTTNGTKTVYVKYQDGAGAVSPTVSDSIVLDTQAPTVGTTSTVAYYINDWANFYLQWHGWSDPGSGLLGYRLIWNTSGNALNTTCTSVFAQTYPNNWASSVLSTPLGVSQGDLVDFRFCAIDNAGNISSVTFSQNAGNDQLAPSSNGSPLRAGIRIVTGKMNDEGTSSLNVTVQSSALTAGGIVPTKMCLSSQSSCTAWQTYDDDTTFTLPAGSGIKNVHAWFRDDQGNQNVAPFIDTVLLDTTAPVNGKMSKNRVLANPVTSTAERIDLVWSGFKDAESDLSGYKIVRAVGSTAPANCSGTDIFGGYNVLWFSDSNVSSNVTYSYRICALNKLAVPSSGITITVGPQAG